MKASFKSIFNLCMFFVLVTVSFGVPSATTWAGSLPANPLAAACGAVSFSAAANFGVGLLGSQSVVVGDFNGDGKPDLAVTNGNNVSVLLGVGNGTFGAATNFGVGSMPFSVAVGDFNGDGKPDLAVANYNSSNVSVLLGNGDGTFGAAVNFPVGFAPYSVAVGDFNGDGKPDLAVANSVSSNVTVLLGVGDGTFGAGTNFVVGTSPRSVVVGDFNGDGEPDLAVTIRSSNNVAVLLGNGDGTFGAGTNFGVGASPYFVTVSDFNGDGKPDLATANVNSDNISVLLGNGDGTFGAATNFGVGGRPVSVAVGDFNGDGKPDLAVANESSFNVSVLLNNCDTLPTVLSHTLQTSNSTYPSFFTITFSEDVSNSGGGTLTDDVTNINNYKIINKGANGTVDTASCAIAVGGDDTIILPPNGGVTYAPNTAIVNLGSALPIGSYRLFVCGTTSIVDLAGNPLNGGADFTFDFTVGAAASASRTGKTDASSLPKTGFAPNKVTTLPAQPADLAYGKLGDLWLEIPSLNVKSTIVGVPQNADKTWSVDWLGNDTGWLNGTAFPTWTGNSVLTAHVTNASGLAGPFAALKSLKYGDQIIVHLGGGQYVYEVRNTRLARPYSTSYAFESKQDASYLTLITCSGYNPLNESYLFRRVVRLVLVEVKGE